ncbi:uncharacterized protein LOC132657145 [Ovis aries]|uniref:uncharacterized protein LOC132657145 n=1 Tax=Ovis aries TaxID=9940 RepID=UPI0029527640|nr:uncharacterized protein LOC132657145 [Ovis aries]
MGAPQRPPQAGGPSAPKSRSHLVCAGDGVSRESAAVGTLGNSLRQRQGCRGAQGPATGCGCGEASCGAGALDAPHTSTPPEASPGAGGPGRWRGSPREAASGRRWEAPSNNGLKIEQAAPEEADPSGEGVGAGRLPAGGAPGLSFSTSTTRVWGPEAEDAGLGGGPPRESLSEDTLPTRLRACPANRFQGWSHVSRRPLPPSEGWHTLWGLHPPTPAPRTRLSASGDKTEPRAQLRWKCQPTCDTLLPRLREPARRREASVSHRQQGGEELGAPGRRGRGARGRARTLPPSEPWGPREPHWRARARG